jgi:hypothetical protein
MGTVLRTASMLARRTKGKCAEMSAASSCMEAVAGCVEGLDATAGNCTAAAGMRCCMLCTPAPLLTTATAARRAMSANRCIVLFDQCNIYGITTKHQDAAIERACFTVEGVAGWRGCVRGSDDAQRGGYVYYDALKLVTASKAM